MLVELEKEGYHVTPTARAAFPTMNREGESAASRSENSASPTSPYRFASTREEFDAAIAEIGFPTL